VNIKSVRNYSKATIPLRSKTKEPYLNFIFVYPIIFDETLVGKYQDKIRSFIALSFLDNIFTENIINIVSKASELDESSNIKISDLIGKVLLGKPIPSDTQNVAFDFMKSEEYKRKIQEKIVDLKKILANNPLIKKLRPKMRMVTLDNLIDVPVIVGTSSDQVNSFTLMLFLITSVGMNVPLITEGNVNKVYNKIKSTPKDKLHTLLVNSVSYAGKDRIYKWLKKIPLIGKKLAISRKKSLIEKHESYASIKLRKISHQVERSPLIDKSFDVMNTLTFYDIDRVKTTFLKMLNKDKLLEEFHLNTATNLSTVVQKISGRSQRIFDDGMNYIESGLSIIGYPLLSSISHLFFYSSHGGYPTKTVTSLYETVFTESFLIKMSEYFDETLKEVIIRNIEKENVSSDKIKLINSYCNDIEGHAKLLEKVKKKINEISIPIPIPNNLDFTISDESSIEDERKYERIQTIKNEIVEFIKMTEKILPLLLKVNNKSWKKLKMLMTDDDFRLIYDSTHSAVNIIINHVNKYFDKYFADNTGSDDFHISAMTGDVFRLITDMKVFLIQVLYFIVTLSIESTFCRLINVIDVELETTKNEVIDFPNYTLVVSLEMVLALYSAYISVNLKQLEDVSFRDKKTVISLTSGYVKGMVEYLTTKLAIPNLVVIDNNTNTVYYKFMNMSKINKIKITTIDSYIKTYSQSNETFDLYGRI